jgi:hypothetical protein
VRGQNNGATEEFTAAIKAVPSAGLLDLRRKAFQQYLGDCEKPPEQVEVCVTQVGEMTVITPIVAEESVQAGRKVLRSLDTEIHLRKLWPWSDEVALIVRSGEDLQMTFAGGNYCANPQCECHHPEPPVTPGEPTLWMYSPVEKQDVGGEQSNRGVQELSGNDPPSSYPDDVETSL